AWLKRIATNMAKDFLRRQRQGAAVPLHVLRDTQLPDRRPNPMAALDSELLRDELRGAIQALPEGQRLTLWMRYCGGMRLQDVAWAMNCPVGTVKSRLFNALRQIRQSFTAEGDNEERSAHHDR